MQPTPVEKPPHVQILDKAHEKGAFSNYIVLVINPTGKPDGSIELHSSIIKGGTLEERFLVEKFLEVSFEARGVLSGRVNPNPR